VTLRSFVVI